MSCPGQAGPPGETSCKAECRTTWYNATASAWGDYANGTITHTELGNQLDAANAALKTCLAGCSSSEPPGDPD